MRGPDDPGTAPARTLRRTQTDAERALWAHLRDRRLAEAECARQMAIGRYYAGFACREGKLIVELDGSQHAESGDDRERDAWLASQGWRVFRFWNGEVARNVTGVLDTIMAAIVERRPSSSPRGRGEGRVSLVGDTASPQGGGEGVSPEESHSAPPPHPRSGFAPASSVDDKVAGALSPPAGRGEGRPASSRTDP
ncbi:MULTISPECIES: endonuclease domain-containing protein [Methylobacterium]|uniref:endonuclease domain-containing protein n=1 Tax=Methylobacterium TaxID=407 RepID=UPI0013ED5214|nr:endonuclease domain-containing protein [Methylobacterium sp. DB0501]NGM32472.1 DUF559 domain-containing protein [Methylobacterium sp. DB0501]